MSLLDRLPYCQASPDGSAHKIVPSGASTIYAFVVKNGMRVYNGISLAPGETKFVPENINRNFEPNSLAFDFGFTPDPKVPDINYLYFGAQSPRYIVRMIGNNTCGNNFCILLDPTDPCAS